MPQETSLVFDPITLIHGAAWEKALSPMVDARYKTMNAPRETVAFRPALEAAFGPMFAELTNHYDEASEKLQAMMKYRPDDWKVQHQRQLALEGMLNNAMTNALQGGLLRTVVSTMAQDTEPTITGEERDIWAKVPSNFVVQEVLRAALAQQRYYQLDHDVPQTLEWLAHDPSNAPFWSGWQRDADTNRRWMSANDDHLSYLLGDLLTKAARNMTLVPVVRTLFERIGHVKGWDHQPNGWGYAGYSAVSSIKGSFTRFRSPEHDALFPIAPLSFWLGMRNQVLSNSGLGAWITSNLLRAPSFDPHGEQAQGLVVNAWLNLDKKEIRALEAAMPGCSQEHLPSVVNVTLHHRSTQRATLADVAKALALPRGRWARATFKRMGAPCEELRDRDHRQAFEQWQKDHPQATAQTLLALRAELEAQDLKKSMRAAFADLDAPSTRARLPRRAPSRRL